jgi:hypothetical protein
MLQKATEEISEQNEGEMMAIKYEKIDITEKSAGLYNVTTKMTIDDFATIHEKEIVLEYRPDRPQYFEKNLDAHTDEFIAEIKLIEVVKAIDISKSLDNVSISANVKYADMAKAVK